MLIKLFDRPQFTEFIEEKMNMQGKIEEKMKKGEKKRN